MKNFYEKVFRIVKQIPPGKVTSYGAIASYIGAKGSARMVGWCLHASKYRPYSIPAHRVVNRNGMLTGKRHFETPDTMQELLENEGLTIKNDQILNFKENFWDPFKELKKIY